MAAKFRPAVALFALLVLSAVAAGAQEWPTRISLDVHFQDEEPDEAEEPAKEEAPAHRSPLIASVWCVISDSEQKPAEEPDDPEDPETEETSSAPGCDAGLGIALYRWRRLALVAVAGSETVGAGLAWIAYQAKTGPVIAIALGIVARYDSRGIQRDVHPALGATLSFGRPGAAEEDLQWKP